MNTQSEFSYIARCKCGEIVCAIVDNPERYHEVSRHIAKWIRDGLTIERVTHDVVRSSFSHCRCDEIAAKALPQQLTLFDTETTS